MTNDVTASEAAEELPPSTDSEIDLAHRPIRRWDVIQALLNRFDHPRYIEVGVSTGSTFHRLDAAHKVAVDPKFRFDWEQEQRDRGPATEYHQVTSDEYFGSIVTDENQFDVIYLDGLHTFEQTLRDLTNALAHLAPRGVIVIDDVRPPSYHASLASQANYHKLRVHVNDTRLAWMGDVYKVVWMIDTFFQSLQYRTISNNHGQAVIWRERRQSVRQRTTAEIADLSFESFVLSRNVLQLRRFDQIIDDLGDHVGRLPDVSQG